MSIKIETERVHKITMEGLSDDEFCTLRRTLGLGLGRPVPALLEDQYSFPKSLFDKMCEIVVDR